MRKFYFAVHNLRVYSFVVVAVAGWQPVSVRRGGEQAGQGQARRRRQRPGLHQDTLVKTRATTKFCRAVRYPPEFDRIREDFSMHRQCKICLLPIIRKIYRIPADIRRSSGFSPVKPALLNHCQQKTTIYSVYVGGFNPDATHASLSARFDKDIYI